MKKLNNFLFKFSRTLDHMQNLHLDSPIVGITSFKKLPQPKTEGDILELFAFCTEEGTIFIGNSENCTVDIEISLPARSEIITKIIWSNDGDYIYVSAGDTIYFFKPQPNSEVKSISLPLRIENIFPHSNGFSAIVHLANNTICNINPVEDYTPTFIGPYPETDKIISIVPYQKSNLVLVIDGPDPRIQLIKPNTFEVIKTFNIEKHSTAIQCAVSSQELGVVVFRADGFWTRYNNLLSATSENLKGQPIFCVSGKSSPSLFVHLNGNYLCCSCEDSVKIFDLKFDAELQKIDVGASQAILFQTKIISVYDKEAHFRDWKGLKQTTTRDLILNQINKANQAKNQKKIEEVENSDQKGEKKEDDLVSEIKAENQAEMIDCEEIEIKFEKGPDDIDQPVQTGVIQSKPDIKFKSLNSVINNIMGNKFVPIPVRQQILEQLNDPSYDDVRDLALFHLSTSIPFNDVLQAVIDKKTINAIIMLKKIEPLNGSQIATFIQTLLKDIDQNEIVLAHFLTQPLTEKAVNEASKILNPDEVDQILYFLALLLASRRYWREFDVSLNTLDAINWWGSILIKNNMTVLALQNKTEGLLKLQEELNNETKRIEAAATCWSIVETIAEEKKEPVPPYFMYLVEKLDIPE